MPFALIKGPVIFQEIMSVALDGKEKHAAAYLDDTLISL